jgi:hypothetical protein
LFLGGGVLVLVAKLMPALASISSMAARATPCWMMALDTSVQSKYNRSYSAGYKQIHVTKI